jgi:ubiquinone/menaquinone biosynthesis C-methylase UbiE
MGKAEWGTNPEFFGPRHAHREGRILHELWRRSPADGLHLECAAGVGSLSCKLARKRDRVVAADVSLRSLLQLRRAARQAGRDGRVLPVLADITRLPFEDETFDSATSAETLEHLPDDGVAAAELARVLAPGGWLVGTVPADPGQWSDWDEWGGHLRRYTSTGMAELLADVGLDPHVRVWGWPIQRCYDDLFLKRVNRRRLRSDRPIDRDPALRRVSALGSRRWLVTLVRLAFEVDRLFDGVPWGVGLIFAAQKPREAPAMRPLPAVEQTVPAPTCP